MLAYRVFWGTLELHRPVGAKVPRNSDPIGLQVQLEFEDKELERLAYDPGASTKRWPPDVTHAYRRRIQQIIAAQDERDLRALKSLHLEKLQGDRKGTYSIRINKKYRLIVRFTTTTAGRTTVVIDGLDYH